MSYPNPCTVPGCRGKIHANGLCQAHLWRLEHYGDTFPHVPIGAFRRERRVGYHGGTGTNDGLGVCVCQVSHPAPKCCTTCGFPCVHRMAPGIRDLALRRVPILRDQIVFTEDERRSLTA